MNFMMLYHKFNFYYLKLVKFNINILLMKDIKTYIYESDEWNPSLSNHKNSYYDERSLDTDRNRKSKKNKKEKSYKKKKFNFCSYIGYKICCGKNDKMIKYYENIREKLISEENIIQNYLDIYELLKLNNIPKKDIIINNK